jgi:hypothetical protein
MANHFDELIKMWRNTTDDHIDWQKKSKTMSIENLFSYVQRLVKEEDEFEAKTEHIKEENPSFDASLLAAKFKNRYAINRFLVSVLVELSFRLMKIMVEESKARKQKTSTVPKKSVLTKEMKREIADQVKLEILKLKRDLQRGSTGKKKAQD